MEPCVDNALRDTLSAFAPSVGGTSLYLLRMVEDTVDGLQAEERLAEATAATARRLTERVAECAVIEGEFLDPADEALRTIECAYKAVEEHLPGFMVAKNSIDSDPELDAQNKELLHACYDRMISALAELVESSKDLCAAVIRHDLAAEPRNGKAFKSVDELVESLRA